MCIPPRAVPHHVRDAKVTVSIFLTTLLLGDTDSPATTTSGLGVLTTDTQAPVVSEATVSTDLLQALKVIAELGVNAVGENLGVLAVDNVALSVKKPYLPPKSAYPNPCLENCQQNRIEIGMIVQEGILY